MSTLSMSLAERIRKISGLAVLADASAKLAEGEGKFAVAQLHRRAQRDATAQLLALIVAPEGQYALKRLEEFAVLAVNFEAHVEESMVFGLDLASGPDLTVIAPAPFGSMVQAVTPSQTVDYLGGRSIWDL